MGIPAKIGGRQQPAFATQRSTAPTGQHATPVELGATKAHATATRQNTTRASRRPPRPGTTATRQVAYGMQSRRKR
jgi:hypothetical protein